MYHRWMDWSRRIRRGYLGMMGLSQRVFVSSSVSNQIMLEVGVSSQTSSSSATMARPSDRRTPIPVRSLLQRNVPNPQPPLAAMGLCKEGSGMVLCPPLRRTLWFLFQRAGSLVSLAQVFWLWRLNLVLIIMLGCLREWCQRAPKNFQGRRVCQMSWLKFFRLLNWCPRHCQSLNP